MKKLLISTAVCAVLCVLMSACGRQVVASGYTGDCTWTLVASRGNYTLIIDGNGEMGNYPLYALSPTWIEYKNSITNLKIKQGVTTIGVGAFYLHENLTSVTIPNSIETIEMFAFLRTGLTSVVIPNSVTSIGLNAFSRNGNLTSVTIGDGVTSIGWGAFSDNENLTSVTIGNSVETIAGLAFAGTGLTSIIIPDNVASIGLGAFSDNENLTSVTIGNSVETIANWAFSRTGLTSVVVPRGVRMESCAFDVGVRVTHTNPIINEARRSSCDDIATPTAQSQPRPSPQAQASQRPRAVSGCNSGTPGWGNSLGAVSFASARTWQVGNQTWSDAVTATACQKTSFNGGSSGDFRSDCRSNPRQRGDLFSWCAVARFGATLCPSPWRVPTRDDFVALDLAFGGTGESRLATEQFVRGNYISYWGGSFGGSSSSNGNLTNQGFWGYYWSQTEISARRARNLYFDTRGIVNPQYHGDKNLGFAVRCVR